MSATPIREFILTGHARQEMARRGIEESWVRQVLARPEQRWALRPGRALLQSRFELGAPAKVYLVRVILDVDREPAQVVTAYRTSKLDKYWRQQP